MCKLCGTNRKPYKPSIIKMPKNNHTYIKHFSKRTQEHLLVVKQYLGENCCIKCLYNIKSYFSPSIIVKSKNWKGEKNIDNYILTRLERTYMNPNFTVNERLSAKNRIFTKENGYSPYSEQQRRRRCQQPQI